ncbi:MAG: glycosyltransferase [Leuconostoc citreum]
MAKTFALIVTYGDHKKQLTTVLQKTLSNRKIDHIFIIDNGSVYDIIEEIEEVSSSEVSIISLKTNTGSAGGFSRGIREVVHYSKNEKDRLLILDDDSYAEPDALDKIDSYEKGLNSDYAHIWSLKRLQLDEVPIMNTQNFDYSLEFFYNSFYRFSVTNKFRKKRYQVPRENQEISHLVMAPYSGLLLNLSVIHKVGFPVEKMYLYSDDIEYTFRISKLKIDILQMYDANIRDIAGSWYNSQSDNVHDAFFEGKENNYRALYAYRNEAYLAKYIFQQNVLLSTLNYYAWMMNIIIRRMPKNKKGFRQLRQLIKVIHLAKGKSLGQLER